MNRKTLILLALCIIAHLFLGWCTFFSRWAMERHWCETLGDGFEPASHFGQVITATSELPPLPTPTTLALRFGMLTPILGLVTLLTAAVIWRKHEQTLLLALLIITLASLSLTAFYSFAIARPPLTITYRMIP